ncbi:MAG: ATPase [Thermodesulfovibrionales bacterium]
MSESVLFTWSGGKDSALALHELLAGGARVSALLTTVTAQYGRVSMHGVREDLLRRQAASLGIPLETVAISADSSNEEYQARMHEALLRHRRLGTARVAFGDIFLEDLRRYREENLRRAGMEAVFPIWGRKTPELARRFLALGFRAVVTCVDSEALDGSFAGREYDESFLSDLPPGVDPCGENGEFHSFVYDGPIFSEPVAVARGEVVVRDGRFHFCDLVPAFQPA